MPISLTTVPAYPLPGLIRISFTPTTGTFVRVWCTAAPLDSELDKRLKKENATRVLVYESDVRQIWKFNADLGGSYTFLAQEYTRNTFGGGFAGDPDGHQTETKVGSEVTLTVYVGEKLTMPIGVGKHESTLVLWVWNDTIRPTTAELHGEVSPRIDPGPSDPARNAARAATVEIAMLALRDANASTVASSVSTVLTDFLTNFNAHLSQATVHAIADTDNSVSLAYFPPYNADPKPSLAAVYERVKAHLENDARDGAGPVAGYHGASDNLNAFLAGPPRDEASAYIFAADLWRVYEAHRVTTTSGIVTIHSNADTVNDLAALPALMNVHKAFLFELAKTAPAASPGQQTGVAALTAIGMKKAN